jgi:hypothetical protein
MHGPEFYPLPNKSVRVRSCERSPHRGLGFAGPIPKSDRRSPVPAEPIHISPGLPSDRSRVKAYHPIDEEPSLRAPHTQTPGATPRKTYRILENRGGVNENRRQNALWKAEENGAPGEIRTPDLTLRRRSLYPAELRARPTRIPHFTHFSGAAASRGAMEGGDERPIPPHARSGDKAAPET